MCTAPKTPQDNSAQVAIQQQQDRENRIRQGQGNIDKAFTQFTPDYYSKFTKSYEDVYNPQVDEQFGNARRDTRYNLARTHTLDSTPGFNAFDKLTEAYGNQRQAVASDALSATNALRGQVEDQKSKLYGLNTAAADPSLAGQQAVSSIGALQTTPKYSPLGDLFGSLVNSSAGYAKGRYDSLPPGYPELFGSRGFAPGGSLPSAGGSGRVVGG